MTEKFVSRLIGHKASIDIPGIEVTKEEAMTTDSAMPSLRNGYFSKNVFENGATRVAYYKIDMEVIDPEEIKINLQMAQLDTLQTIKSCVVFFVVLLSVSVLFTVLSIVGLLR